MLSFHMVFLIVVCFWCFRVFETFARNLLSLTNESPDPSQLLYMNSHTFCPPQFVLSQNPWALYVRRGLFPFLMERRALLIVRRLLSHGCSWMLNNSFSSISFTFYLIYRRRCTPTFMQASCTSCISPRYATLCLIFFRLSFTFIFFLSIPSLLCLHSFLIHFFELAISFKSRKHHVNIIYCSFISLSWNEILLSWNAFWNNIVFFSLERQFSCN